MRYKTNPRHEAQETPAQERFEHRTGKEAIGKFGAFKKRKHSSRSKGSARGK